MTYPPKTMLKTALFFATKTEHHYTPVKDFAARIANTEAEEILASEFILTQGLRFTFDVRHPLRAHVGMTMELQAMAAGKLDSGSSSSSSSSIPADLEARVGKAYGAIRSVLKTHAQVTDVYFHYTPSQICFAAMYLADASLATWYLGVKMAGEQHEAGVRAVQTVQRCAAMLREYDSLGMGEPSSEEKKELRRLTKKLGKCMDPEKMDLVGLQRAKREGADDLEGDKRAKKRKLERESVQQEGADLFGPALGVSRA